MNSYKFTATKQRLDLLMEIEQTPEENIPELLNFVRLFRQVTLAKQTSINAWDNAINQINNSDQNPEKLKKIFESWAELDDETEQQETFKIIESLESVSIE
jgi:hypothetical protein